MKKSKKVVVILISIVSLFLLIYIFKPFNLFRSGMNSSINDFIGGLFVSKDSLYGLKIIDDSNATLQINKLINDEVVKDKVLSFTFEVQEGHIKSSNTSFNSLIINDDEIWMLDYKVYLFRYNG